MIVSRLTGGLGNQMFQYAAGLALAHQHLTVLKLDVGWFSINSRQPGTSRRQYALHCFNVQEHFATQEEIASLLGQSGGICEKLAYRAAIVLGMHRLSRTLGPNAGHLHTQQSETFYSSFFDQPDNTYLSGTFQSEKFFKPIVEQVRLQFGFRYGP